MSDGVKLAGFMFSFVSIVSICATVESAFKYDSQARAVTEARIVKLESDVGHLGSRIDKQRECMCSREKPGDVKDIQPPYGEKK